MGSHVYVSGTTATDAAGALVGVGDATLQARQALDNVRRALHALGAELDDVVRTRMYVVRPDDAARVAHVHGEYFGSIRPATALVIVAGLIEPEMLVEIEADAFVPVHRAGDR